MLRFFFVRYKCCSLLTQVAAKYITTTLMYVQRVQSLVLITDKLLFLITDKLLVLITDKLLVLITDKILFQISKKRGLSLEEKRTRMMEIFFEAKDVFQLKDIEKIAPKTKGISPMTVKDVLQSLVDDNMVDCERVGTSNYYWAFPSKALNARKHKLEDLQKQISDAKQRKVNLQKVVEKAKVGRQDTKERSSLLKELQALREERTQLKAEVEKYRECDPEVVEEMRKSNVTAKEAVSRWTDNVFAIKSWTKKKFAFDDRRINKAFGIPEDFDYMD